MVVQGLAERVLADEERDGRVARVAVDFEPHAVHVAVLDGPRAAAIGVRRHGNHERWWRVPPGQRGGVRSLQGDDEHQGDGGHAGPSKGWPSYSNASGKFLMRAARRYRSPVRTVPITTRGGCVRKLLSLSVLLLAATTLPARARAQDTDPNAGHTSHGRTFHPGSGSGWTL